MIVFIHHSVNPYRVAFFNKLFQAGVDFKVYFLSKPAKNRKWQTDDFSLDFPHTFLPGKKLYIPGNDHSYFQFNSGVIRELKNDQPSLIIMIGWNYLATFQAAWFAKQHQLPYIVWNESTPAETTVQRSLTKPAVKWLIKHSWRCIAAGSRAKKYLKQLGAPAEKIDVSYYTVDTTALLEQIKSIPKKDVQEIRHQLSIASNELMLLYVGQLIKRKGVHQLLKLATELKDDPVHLILIGYGPLEETVQQHKTSHKLNKLHHTAYLPNQQVMIYMKAADAFILPSLEDTWGLVVNEAMIAGLPVLVSHYAGCSSDLVENGQNGWVIDPHKSKEIAEKIRQLQKKPERRKKMGQHSRRKIQATATVEKTVERIKQYQQQRAIS